MLGDFIYSAGRSASAEAVANDVSVQFGVSGKSENNVKRFLIIAVIIVAIGLILFFAISPFRAFTLVEVKSFPGFGKNDVFKVAGIGSGASYVSLKAGEVQRALAGHYMVETARVVKRFPDRLSIFIEPRQAVAVILADVNGDTRPVYVDRHGIPFVIGKAEGLNLPSWLPVVSGIPAITSRLGSPLSSAFLPMFAKIGTIYDEEPGLWQAISEINIVRKDFGRFDLVLHPVKYPVKLRMTEDISKESLRYALLMLDVFVKEGIFPNEIDVRSGIGVVKAKEVRFGE